jgi:uncharacterized FlgJ-related protein
MFYKYNKKQLQYQPINEFIGQIIVAVIAIFIAVAVICYKIGQSTAETKHVELEAALHVVKEQEEPFSKEALIEMIKELGIKHPEIVLAQSILETGHWTSNIFKENYNLFGMKQARSRIRTAKGTQLNHAYYNSWQESVYDYAFYQCRYLSKISSDEDYFAALDASYAEANNYSMHLKKIIEKEELRKLFYDTP